MKKGNKKILENEDIPELREADKARTLHSVFKEQLRKRKQRHLSNDPSILTIIFFCQWKAILVSGFFALLKTLAMTLSPLLLIAFTKVVDGNAAFRYEVYALTAGLFVAKMVESLSERQWFFRTRLIGLQIRSLISATIYQKQLRLSNAAKKTHSPGERVNYVTVDAYKIGEFPFWLHQIWLTQATSSLLDSPPGSASSFSFAFNNPRFSDRILRIQILPDIPASQSDDGDAWPSNPTLFMTESAADSIAVKSLLCNVTSSYMKIKMRVKQSELEEQQATLTIQESGSEQESAGSRSLLGTPWTTFMADDSIYFINSFLHLQAKLIVRKQH